MTALSRKKRQIVRDKSGGLCWYCGCELPTKGWHADHLKPIVRVKNHKKLAESFEFGEIPKSVQALLDNKGLENPENDKLSNIVPACAPCNLFKATYTIEQFREEIELQAERARNYSVNFRTAERFGLIEVNDKPVVFWFETQQK